jgi:hypothetical protein
MDGFGAGRRSRHGQRLDSSAERRMVRYGEIGTERSDDLSNQSFGLTKQAEHRAQSPRDRLTAMTSEAVRTRLVRTVWRRDLVGPDENPSKRQRTKFVATPDPVTRWAGRRTTAHFGFPPSVPRFQSLLYLGRRSRLSQIWAQLCRSRRIQSQHSIVLRQPGRESARSGSPRTASSRSTGGRSPRAARYAA